jgi:hypothetical protein
VIALTRLNATHTAPYPPRARKVGRTTGKVVTAEATMAMLPHTELYRCPVARSNAKAIPKYSTAGLRRFTIGGILPRSIATPRDRSCTF